MKLQAKLNDDIFSSRCDIYGFNGALMYWSQYDFAYKKRVHIYDAGNNEIGYVQYRILANQNNTLVFDKNDQPINVDDYKVADKQDGCNFKLLLNDKVVLSVSSNDNNSIIEIDDNNDINKCLLALYRNIE